MRVISGLKTKAALVVTACKNMPDAHAAEQIIEVSLNDNIRAERSVFCNEKACKGKQYLFADVFSQRDITLIYILVASGFREINESIVCPK